MKQKILMWDVDTQGDFMDPKGKLYVPGAENSELRGNLSKLTNLGNRSTFPEEEFPEDFRIAGKYILAGEVDAHLPDDIEFKDWPEHCVYGTHGQRKIGETIGIKT